MKKLILSQRQKIRTFLSTIRGPADKGEDLEFKLLAPKGALKGKVSDKIELPMNKYELLDSFLQMFYNSTSQNGRVNGQHLAFVIGAEGSGKTSLIKQSLKAFRSRKKRSEWVNKTKIEFTSLSTPQLNENIQREIKIDNQFSVTLEFDFKKSFMMKPQAFFHHIQHQIISQILTLNQTISTKKDSTLLDPCIIKQIVMAQNSSEYTFVLLKDTIYAILCDCDAIELSKESIQKLEELNERIIDMDHQTFLSTKSFVQQTQSSLTNSDIFNEFINIISQDYKISATEATIKIFLSAFRRMQYEFRPLSYSNRDYQTGIQTTKFLFSILNYLCGFGNLNKKSLNRFINDEPNIFESYFVGKGNHIDTVMAFYHLDKLSCFKDKKFTEWFDNLIICLQNGSNLRTHFPVLIELGTSEALIQLQKLGRFQPDNPSIIQIPGYFKSNIHRYSPPHVFNQKTLERLRPVLGRNPSTWNETIIAMSEGAALQSILLGNTTVMQKRRTIFESRINRFYLQPENLPFIDDNTLKMHLNEFLFILFKTKGFMKNYYLHLHYLIFKNPIWMNFYRTNILYYHFYEPAINLSDHRDLIYINDFFKAMNIFKRIQLYLWRKLKSPYKYYFKELRYNEKIEQEFQENPINFSFRSDYEVKEAFGPVRDYKMIHYRELLKFKYNT